MHCEEGKSPSFSWDGRWKTEESLEEANTKVEVQTVHITIYLKPLSKTSPFSIQGTLSKFFPIMAAKTLKNP